MAPSVKAGQQGRLVGIQGKGALALGRPGAAAAAVEPEDISRRLRRLGKGSGPHKAPNCGVSSFCGRGEGYKTWVMASPALSGPRPVYKQLQRHQTETSKPDDSDAEFSQMIADGLGSDAWLRFLPQDSLENFVQRTAVHCIAGI